MLGIIDSDTDTGVTALRTFYATTTGTNSTKITNRLRWMHDSH